MWGLGELRSRRQSGVDVGGILYSVSSETRDQRSRVLRSERWKVGRESLVGSPGVFHVPTGESRYE